MVIEEVYPRPELIPGASSMRSSRNEMYIVSRRYICIYRVVTNCRREYHVPSRNSKSKTSRVSTA